MVNVTRRGLFRLGAGAAATAVAVLSVPLVPGTALAVAVVDDAIIGAAVAAIAALGGYLVTSGTAPSSLEALGAGFRGFVQSQSVKAQAVSLCMQAAVQYGADIQEVDAQAAADAVAGVTGFFGSALESAATTGRLVLDGVVSGATAGAGVLRSLVSLYVNKAAEGTAQLLLSDAEHTSMIAGSFQFSQLTSPYVGAYVDTIDNIWASTVASSSHNYVGLLHVRVLNNGTWSSEAVFGIPQVAVPVTLTCSNDGLTLALTGGNGRRIRRYRRSSATGSFGDSSEAASWTLGTSDTSGAYTVSYRFSSSMVASGALPVVDRASDAPDVITPGYDSVPLGQDLVIDGTTGAVSGAGSIPLPQSVPDVIGGLNDWLDGALAGVVPGTIALPVPVSTPVVVATPEGIATMPIEQARAQDTSLVELGYVPPVSPIDPPVTVPEGPWTPAVTLPFESVWPFNMIYDVVELFRDLGA